MKLVQLYKQVKEENEKLGKILVPRRSSEERAKNFLVATNKKIQEYIKNGSQGNLDLENTPITSLPNNLTEVKGSLFLSNTKIINLPDSLSYVGGNLVLINTNITSLPEKLTVKDSLFLKGTPITSLPNNLTVGRYLDLSGTKITNLPKDLTVGGSLNLENTPISKQYTIKQFKQMVPGVKGNIYS
jgi:hypothetical protein